ncbi:MAG: NADH-quinone oxidoreductase subunit J [Deltaproteobacteria bacterium]|jgi:NADH-quinone oxidoreductase subunit J|nr:NADH-quinone oxidoreductase subunit J [Deltaproteobacteria bacterium]
MDQIITHFLAALRAPLDALEGLIASWLPGQQVAALVAFGVYVLIILAGGLLAIGSRNLVRAMMGLILTFLGVAGFYLLLASPFLAFMQLLIYVGAVGVLVFFAIMLTKNNTQGEEANLPKLSNGILGFLAGLAPLVALGPLIVLYGPKIGEKSYQATDTAILGRGLITTDLVSFELISIILLTAMAGGVFLAWRRRPQSRSN